MALYVVSRGVGNFHFWTRGATAQGVCSVVQAEGEAPVGSLRDEVKFCNTRIIR